MAKKKNGELSLGLELAGEREASREYPNVVNTFPKSKQILIKSSTEKDVGCTNAISTIGNNYHNGSILLSWTTDRYNLCLQPKSVWSGVVWPEE